MNRIVNFIKKHWLLISFILFFILKLFIVHIQPILVKGQTHDDIMFITNASSILHGNWLGEYNDITLSKGVVGILFIALAGALPISYLTTQQIIYFLACLCMAKMLSNFIKNKKILLIFYLILLFNPISYSDAFSFVYRDGLYISLLLFFIAFSFQIFFNYRNIKKIIIYSFLFGLSFTAMYFCREESIWLAPYLIACVTIIIFQIFRDKKCSKKMLKISSIFGISIFIFLITTISISLINNKYYGRFITNDFTSKDFKDAYGAITRIYQENYIERVPLNEETIQVLYELSPKFKELEPYLEDTNIEIYRKIDGEFQDGWLYWALRIAVKEAGYYKDAQAAKEYYVELAKEINDLCETKELSCLPKRSSLVAPFNKALVDNVIEYIPRTFAVQLTYENVYVQIPQIKVIKSFEDFTQNKSSYSENDLKSINLSIMKLVLAIYQKVNPIIMVVSLICYTVYTILFFLKKSFRKNYKKLILLNGLLSLYLIRILVVGYIAATEYASAIEKSQYLACIYPVQSLFSLLAIYFIIDKGRIKQFLKKHEKTLMLLRFSKNLKNIGNTYCCNICKFRFKKMIPGGHKHEIFDNNEIIGAGYRENVYCPICFCKDKDRLVFYYIKKYTNILTGKNTILHFAPEKKIKHKIEKNRKAAYIDGDINEKHASHVIDITDICYPDNYFDYIIVNHVLEHIEDEKSALMELKRVIKPGGGVILTVPICISNAKTIEDKKVISKEERMSKFCQEDHVRLYGRDFASRIRKYGLDVYEYNIEKEEGIEIVHKYGILEKGIIFIISKKK